MRSLWRAERLCVQREIRAYICLCLKDGMPGMWAISGNLYASNSVWADHCNLSGTRWLMRNQRFLDLLMSNGGMSICWQASGNFHLRWTVHSVTGCYKLCLRAGGTRSADYSQATACSSDSVKVSLSLNKRVTKLNGLMHTNKLFTGDMNLCMCVYLTFLRASSSSWRFS